MTTLECIALLALIATDITQTLTIRRLDQTLTRVRCLAEADTGKVWRLESRVERLEEAKKRDLRGSSANP